VIISAISPREKDWKPTMIKRIPTKKRGLLLIEAPSKNLSSVRYKIMKNPMIEDNTPKNPKRCRGFLINFVVNITVSKSRNPFKNLLAPNLVVPYFLG
jgi:hypothetical protein